MNFKDKNDEFWKNVNNIPPYMVKILKYYKYWEERDVNYHQLSGVREGTVVTAILVGIIARFLKRKIGFIEEKYIVINNVDIEVSMNN